MPPHNSLGAGNTTLSPVLSVARKLFRILALLGVHAELC
jgi:hypothetical protein